MEIKILELKQFEEVKQLFKSVFMSEPWNDDWRNDAQLTDYMLDLTGNRNSLSIGLYDNGELTGVSLGNMIGRDCNLYE